MTLQLTLACGHYDRTEGLRDGSVRVEGVDLTYLDLPPEETFFRMARFGEFDAAEMSLSTYVASLQTEARPMVAIPAFPSRLFRHSCVYVNAASGIESPQDLVGKTVGIAEYQLTANVWIRGILEEFYGVPLTSVAYRTGGLHEAGRIEKAPVAVPDGVDIAPIRAGATLSELLVSGEIDAVYTPRTPEPFHRGDPAVRRLWPDAREQEENYFQQTGVFPIMHVVAMRREVYEANRWIARSLMKAFEAARVAVRDAIEETVAARYMLPWLHDEVSRTRSVLGDDYWRYGLEGNEATLDAFLRYARQQGICGREMAPEELFAPEALEVFRI